MTPNLEPVTPATEPSTPWKTAGKLAIGFLVVFAIAALLGALFREPIEALGTAAVERYGLVGLSVSVWLVDMIPTPLSYVPFMFLGLAGGMPFGAVLLTSATASYLAGFTGYGIGRTVGMPARLEDWMHRKHPKVRVMLDRHGVWGVAAIGLLPLPLAIGTWSAGALKLPLPQVALALLVRFPKTIFYLWMLESGMQLGAG